MSRKARRSSPPLGPALEAAAVVAPPATASSLAELVALLPEPRALGAGGWLAVSQGTPAPSGLIQRLLGRSSAGGVPLRLRCTALLLRGYADVSADETGVAWGRAPGPAKATGTEGSAVIVVTPADATGDAPDARAPR